jgi:hypothetical protein
VAFNNFAWDASIAEHAFLLRTLADLVQFPMK